MYMTFLPTDFSESKMLGSYTNSWADKINHMPELKQVLVVVPGNHGGCEDVRSVFGTVLCKRRSVVPEFAFQGFSTRSSEGHGYPSPAAEPQELSRCSLSTRARIPEGCGAAPGWSSAALWRCLQLSVCSLSAPAAQPAPRPSRSPGHKRWLLACPAERGLCPAGLGRSEAWDRVDL